MLKDHLMQKVDMHTRHKYHNLFYFHLFSDYQTFTLDQEERICPAALPRSQLYPKIWYHVQTGKSGNDTLVFDINAYLRQIILSSLTNI